VTIRFGLLFMPTPPDQFARWCHEADEAGFERIGIGDSQSLYRDVYVSCTLAALNTSRALIGPRVTNPVTRHPAVTASAIASIDELSGGRAFLGIGTGHSALLNLGQKPASRDTLRAYVECVRALFEHGEAEYEGRVVRLDWPRRRPPMVVAAAGPKALELAGEIADGVVVGCGMTQPAIDEAFHRLETGARRSGRTIADLDLWWYVPTNVHEDSAAAVEEVRPAVVSGAHAYFYGGVKDRAVPEHLEAAVQRLADEYVVEQHTRPGQSADNAELVDRLGLREYVVERFGIAGDPDEVTARIQTLHERGIDNFWMSMHAADKGRVVRLMRDHVMPHFR
jgi:5,10-methylenetetrahydromethanopterin reductase